MAAIEFGALLFWTEVSAVTLTALFLRRWMQPPRSFGGRWWRSLLACLASLPVTALAVFGLALAVGYPADESYSPGTIAGQALVGSLGRAVILWPLVVAWLIVKPKAEGPPITSEEKAG